MSKYEPFDPAAGRRDPLAIEVRRAQPGDSAEIAPIDVERNGGVASEVEAKVRASIERGHDKTWVALSSGRVVAYGKVSWIDAEREATRGRARSRSTRRTASKSSRATSATRASGRPRGGTMRCSVARSRPRRRCA